MFLIDPVEQKVSLADLDPTKPFLDECRRLMQATQVQTLAVNEGKLVLFIDGFGLLKGPTQRFFTLTGGDIRFAGRALLSAVDIESGMLRAIPADYLERAALDVSFVPHSVTLTGIDERLVCRPGEIPVVARMPTFSDGGEIPLTSGTDEPETEAPFRWVLSRRADGSVRAVRFALDGNSLAPTALLSAATLDELRAQLPSGLIRLEPDDDADESVIEYLTAPQPAPEAIA